MTYAQKIPYRHEIHKLETNVRSFFTRMLSKTNVAGAFSFLGAGSFFLAGSFFGVGSFFEVGVDASVGAGVGSSFRVGAGSSVTCGSGASDGLSDGLSEGLSEGFFGSTGTGIGGFFWLSWKVFHWAGVSFTVRLPSGLGLGFGVGLIPSNVLFCCRIGHTDAGICRTN